MQLRGWTLPDVCYIQQNIASPELQTFARRTIQRGNERRALELVFFGKLEERKGVGLFCDALDLLGGGELAFSVTFLGQNGTVSGRDVLSYIRTRAKPWAFTWRALTDHGHEAALRFLLEGAGRIAIIPSLEDNLPNTVVECLAARIPFLASRTGGIPELIADSDVERVTFRPRAYEFADSLNRALRDGVPIAQPAIDADENKQRWIDWHAAMASRHILDAHAQTQIGATAVPPLVSVCLNFREGVAALLQAVGSLRRQNRANLEVILSDYSEAGVEALSELHDLRSDFESKGWRIIRAAQCGTSIARTTAVDHARGDYVLFMDGADYAKPDAVATFVGVAERTGADILSCFLVPFSGVEEPNEEALLGHWPFLGAAVLLGVFRNHFGSRCIFVRKSGFSRLAGGGAQGKVDCADWEFLARAALMGLRLEVIPKALVWYRVQDNSCLNQPSEYYDHLRAIRPYAEAMPLALRGLPNAALTMKMQYEREYGMVKLAQQRLQSLRASPSWRVTSPLREIRRGAVRVGRFVRRLLRPESPIPS
jgi:hypothetical protein